MTFSAFCQFVKMTEFSGLLLFKIVKITFAIDIGEKAVYSITSLYVGHKTNDNYYERYNGGMSL